ncbi:MAG: pseudouridine synthase [Saprospiraceae bacterium]|nr:pseudouridine synthase [Saprospiraceae bacterium]MBK9721437.1 pseudouridine synthase [Saprospiraceae bacterium]
MYYYKIYKPYGVLSQFSKKEPEQVTLQDVFKFPKAVYPIGRLDKDSEGLLILSDDITLNNKLLNPKFKMPKSYLAQVEGIPTQEALKKLESGILIKIDGKSHKTLPATVKLMDKIPNYPERIPPIRIRKSIPDRWIEITIHEGKNRQVRRMFAAVGFPVLRLIRISIGPIQLGTLQAGKTVLLNNAELLALKV